MSSVVYEIKTDEANLRQFHIEYNDPILIDTAITLLSELPIIDSVSFEASTLSLWKYPIDSWCDLRYWESFHSHFSINACIAVLTERLEDKKHETKTSH